MKELKINRTQINNIANLYKAHEQEAKNLKGRAPEQEKDEVILSKEARELLAATKNDQEIEKSGEDRTKRIAEVKVLIEKGQYHVDSKLVAEKMIERALNKKKV